MHPFGGLGINSLRILGPLIRRERLLNLKLQNFTNDPAAISFLAKEIDSANRRLRIGGFTIDSRETMNDYWRHKTLVTDGKGLSEAHKVPKAYSWIVNPSRLLSGHEFVMSTKLSFNALPVKSRTSRGRAQIDRSCRTGCSHPVTLNHFLQQCHRTHGPR